MLDLRYEKVVVWDATFGTNDKKVWLNCFCQCVIFSRSTWSSQLLTFYFVTNLVVYIHGLPRMAKWNSCGLNHIFLEQE